MRTITWPDTVDEILDGDHVVMLAYVTPANGVVLTPVTNFGVRDRAAGTVTVNSSVGAWKKLDRMRRNPHVALAFHTRRHATHGRHEYVLVQGRAKLSEPIPDYPSSILEHWERFERWRDLSPLWKRWLRVYALRVGIEVAVDQIVVWPELDARGTPTVIGAPLASEPAPEQPAPAKGSGPRVNHKRGAKRAARLPDVLLGWLGADGLPLVVPVTVAGSEERGIVLEPPPGLVPPGGRRAGLTAHRFSRNVVGQHQRIHTGWLRARPPERQVAYAPHTQAAYRFPPSTLLYHTLTGLFTRLRVRQAKRSGLFSSSGSCGCA